LTNVAVHQIRPHSDAAAIVLSNISNIIQGGLLPSYCGKFFHQSVSSKTFKLMQFLKIIYASLSADPLPQLASPAVDDCHGK